MDETNIKSQLEEDCKKYEVICHVCNEKMPYKYAYAEEHLKKYPDHKSYRTILKE